MAYEKSSQFFRAALRTEYLGLQRRITDLQCKAAVWLRNQAETKTAKTEVNEAKNSVIILPSKEDLEEVVTEDVKDNELAQKEEAAAQELSVPQGEGTNAGQHTSNTGRVEPFPVRESNTETSRILQNENTGWVEPLPVRDTSSPVRDTTNPGWQTTPEPIPIQENPTPVRLDTNPVRDNPYPGRQKPNPGRDNTVPDPDETVPDPKATTTPKAVSIPFPHKKKKDTTEVRY